jgi:hypothetical protein
MPCSCGRGRRDVNDPRALAVILEKAEAHLRAHQHPDPYTRECTAGCCCARTAERGRSRHGARWHQVGAQLAGECINRARLALEADPSLAPARPSFRPHGGRQSLEYTYRHACNTISSSRTLLQ